MNYFKTQPQEKNIKKAKKVKIAKNVFKNAKNILKNIKIAKNTKCKKEIIIQLII